MKSYQSIIVDQVNDLKTLAQSAVDLGASKREIKRMALKKKKRKKKAGRKNWFNVIFVTKDFSHVEIKKNWCKSAKMLPAAIKLDLDDGWYWLNYVDDINKVALYINGAP